MKSRIISALETVDQGVFKYQKIMNALNAVDVSNDRDFQKLFNGFYKMRQRKEDYYKAYFKYLEENKNSPVKYADVLMHFYTKFNRVEASFASKLVATIDSSKPIIDKYVLKNLDMKLPYAYDSFRISKIIAIYSTVEMKMLELCQSPVGQETIALFDLKFPQNTISSMKKLDFVLWKIR
jgi:hypothetical protein